MQRIQDNFAALLAYLVVPAVIFLGACPRKSTISRCL
jgi:hypothetical protein